MKVPTILTGMVIGFRIDFFRRICCETSNFHSSLCFKMFDVAKNSAYFY